MSIPPFKHSEPIPTVSLFRSAAFVDADLNAGTGVAPELDEFLGFRPAFTWFGFCCVAQHYTLLTPIGE
jgi:hypothetical protein